MVIRTTPLLLFFVCTVRGPAAQQEIRVDGPPLCDRCTIEVRSVVRLDPHPELTFGQFGIAIARDGRGRFIAGDRFAAEARALVFGADGTFVRALGRPGSGPREDGMIGQIFGTAGDSVVILDEALGRAAVFDAAGRFVRGARGGGDPAQSAARLADGRIVVNVARPGSPIFRILAIDLESSREAGPAAGRVGDFEEATRVLAPATGGGFWAGRRDSYAIEQWAAGGQLLRVLRRNADWFRPADQRAWMSGQSPPGASINGLRQDGEHLLWVIGMAAAREWKPLPARKPAGREIPVPGFFVVQDQFDSVIELIDLRRRRVVASRRLPDLIWVSSDGVMYRATRNRRGEPVVDVVRISLVTAGR